MKEHIFGNESADIVLIQPIDERGLKAMEREASLIRELSGKDFCLRTPVVSSWNRDLSPWRAPAVFGNEDFGQGAADTLAEVLKICGDRRKTYYIGGYSLAGLFALWSVYQTEVFAGAAAASPSLWFPGFTEYMRENRIRTGSVYISLGDKEAGTKNPVMAAVADKAKEAYNILKENNTDCTFEWNPGNHFKDTDIRTAKAFARLLGPE
ncbi:MAG: esterase [Lachnospiraceae bacterium]|nr:esterase [Lachnospiraceae bacterium]